MSSRSSVSYGGFIQLPVVPKNSLNWGDHSKCSSHALFLEYFSAKSAHLVSFRYPNFLNLLRVPSIFYVNQNPHFRICMIVRQENAKNSCENASVSLSAMS
ncbi:hypothetical protein OIU77_004317 [Salix suchowensis]|uniref:Uncharacterized protein n=1 Tax=Salix suchowensis TaxID=1278906 RepID=A0ABQ9AU79_9ROSI|nr:hypothetical protein OIU77_004317 [Salix suchowensis]